MSIFQVDIIIVFMFGIGPAMLIGFFIGRAYQIRSDISEKY